MVDFPEVRLALWLIWFFAAIPCLLLSITGIVYGGYSLFRADNFGAATAESLPMVAGMFGIFGIFGAAIRLANRAPALAHEKLRRRLAKSGLFAGVVVSLFPLSKALSGDLWNLLFMGGPFCIGLTLFIGTIGIGKRENEFE